MAKKSHFDYFDAFQRIGDFADQEADMLLGILTDYDADQMPRYAKEMHAIENAADQVNHEVFTAIVAEFITPIDREDIINLTQELDDVVDRVESVMQHMYMLNIQAIDVPEAVEMARIIAQSTEALHQALIEFPNYKKSKTIHEKLVSVNTLEEEADTIYIEAIHRIYQESVDADTVQTALHTVAWTKVFDRLERSCDACEHAADVITTIIMKNT